MKGNSIIGKVNCWLFGLFTCQLVYYFGFGRFWICGSLFNTCTNMAAMGKSREGRRLLSLTTEFTKEHRDKPDAFWEHVLGVSLK